MAQRWLPQDFIEQFLIDLDIFIKKVDHRYTSSDVGGPRRLVDIVY